MQGQSEWEWVVHRWSLPQENTHTHSPCSANTQSPQNVCGCWHLDTAALVLLIHLQFNNWTLSPKKQTEKNGGWRGHSPSHVSAGIQKWNLMIQFGSSCWQTGGLLSWRLNSSFKGCLSLLFSVSPCKFMPSALVTFPSFFPTWKCCCVGSPFL